MKRIRFVMLGGFLGAGKTTAIARLARHWAAAGKNVGLVTNDQAYGLVDTESLRAQGFQVGEVTGACFCCKFNDLVATVEQLSAERQPDIIIAEPVGSCTDLAATVIEPLRHLHAGDFDVAPLAVLLKPDHGRKILSGEDGVGFSPKAAYIFLTQLEEADVVAINKIDQLDAAAREQLLRLVRERYPEKKVVAVSARHGEGFDELIASLESRGPAQSHTPEVDYDVYAAGEAELGWLNCRVDVESGGEAFALDEALVDLVARFARACRGASAEPAHLKILASSDGATAIANLVSSDAAAELSLASGAAVRGAELTINARIAVAPELLSELVKREVAAWSAARGFSHAIADLQSFRPGRPVPTHRMASL
ncbi:MAG TPA: GTP-binding protein [Pirellulales bacterium]|nr:GTP-binding protein [Pirellulales bacterium]